MKYFLLRKLSKNSSPHWVRVKERSFRWSLTSVPPSSNLIPEWVVSVNTTDPEVRNSGTEGSFFLHVERSTELNTYTYTRGVRSRNNVQITRLGRRTFSSFSTCTSTLRPDHYPRPGEVDERSYLQKRENYNPYAHDVVEKKVFSNN